MQLSFWRLENIFISNYKGLAIRDLVLDKNIDILATPSDQKLKSFSIRISRSILAQGLLSLFLNSLFDKFDS